MKIVSIVLLSVLLSVFLLFVNSSSISEESRFEEEFQAFVSKFDSNYQDFNQQSQSEDGYQRFYFNEIDENNNRNALVYEVKLVDNLFRISKEDAKNVESIICDINNQLLTIIQYDDSTNFYDNLPYFLPSNSILIFDVSEIPTRNCFDEDSQTQSNLVLYQRIVKDVDVDDIQIDDPDNIVLVLPSINCDWTDAVEDAEFFYHTDDLLNAKPLGEITQQQPTENQNNNNDNQDDESLVKEGDNAADLDEAKAPVKAPSKDSKDPKEPSLKSKIVSGFGSETSNEFDVAARKATHKQTFGWNFDPNTAGATVENINLAKYKEIAELNCHNCYASIQFGLTLSGKLALHEKDRKFHLATFAQSSNSFGLEFVAKSGVKSWSFNKNFGSKLTILKNRYLFNLGIVPIFLKLETQFKMQAELDFDSSVTVGIGWSANYFIGRTLDYSNSKWVLAPLQNTLKTAYEPLHFAAEGSVHGNVGLGVDIFITVDGLLTSTLTVIPQLDAQIQYNSEKPPGSCKEKQNLDLDLEAFITSDIHAGIWKKQPIHFNLPKIGPFPIYSSCFHVPDIKLLKQHKASESELDEAIMMDNTGISVMTKSLIDWNDKSITLYPDTCHSKLPIPKLTINELYTVSSCQFPKASFNSVCFHSNAYTVNMEFTAPRTGNYLISALTKQKRALSVQINQNELCGALMLCTNNRDMETNNVLLLAGQTIHITIAPALNDDTCDTISILIHLDTRYLTAYISPIPKIGSDTQDDTVHSYSSPFATINRGLQYLSKHYESHYLGVYLYLLPSIQYHHIIPNTGILIPNNLRLINLFITSLRSECAVSLFDSYTHFGCTDQNPTQCLTQEDFAAVGTGTAYDTIIACKSNTEDCTVLNPNNNGPKLTINGLGIHNFHRSSGDGGAIIISKHSEVTISNSFFYNNRAPKGRGGTIIVEESSILNLRNSVFVKSSALEGGTISVLDNSMLYIGVVSIIQSTATKGNGGAISIGSEYERISSNKANTGAIIQGWANLFEHCKAEGFGGAIAFSHLSGAETNHFLVKSSFTSNSAKKGGRDIYISSGPKLSNTLVLYSCDFTVSTVEKVRGSMARIESGNKIIGVNNQAMGITDSNLYVVQDLPIPAYRFG